MSIVIKYVVEHKGVEKLVTTDKKEADKYDKMLDVADNLADYIGAKGIKLEAETLEELTIMLAKNKDSLNKLLRGISAEQALAENTAAVVEMEPLQAQG